jgi:peptide/nickel transport system ATP-binding protein
MLLRVENAHRSYRLPRTHLLRTAPLIRAVQDVSLTVGRGEILGIVGESGSGKSTLARMIMGFEPPDQGHVRLNGQDLATLGARVLRQARRQVQMVFQDPYDSLDPRRSIGWSVAEPLLAGGMDAPARHARAADMLSRVGLSPADMARYPHEFSGGQRQRIAIARAIAPEPALLVADEPVAALDVSVQAQVLNLLMDLNRHLGLAMVFISHDLAVVASIADRIAVMQAGRIVELGTTAKIVTTPEHPYTKALFAAA